MPKRQPPDWFLPQWRKYRELSQEKLADLAGFGSKSYVSEVESGKRRYNEDMLKAFAKALGCAPRDIMNVNPLLIGKGDLPAGVVSIMDVVRRVPEGEREEFIDSVKAALDRLSKKKKLAAQRKKQKSA